MRLASSSNVAIDVNFSDVKLSSKSIGEKQVVFPDR